MKNGSWPSGVTVALLSHSTWMRPAKVSVTTGPADIRSITGCSPAGNGGKSPRFLPIAHDISDLPNRRWPPSPGFRIIYRKAKPESDRLLDRPEIPLHTNGSENDIRCQ